MKTLAILILFASVVPANAEPTCDAQPSFWGRQTCRIAKSSMETYSKLAERQHAKAERSATWKHYYRSRAAKFEGEAKAARITFEHYAK